MSRLTLTPRRVRRTALAVALVCALAAAVLVSRPDRAQSVVPPSDRIGTLTFGGLSPAVVPLRRFAFEVEADAPAGSTAAGPARFGNPVVTLDTDALSPTQLATIAGRRRIAKLTVVLYRPGTTAKSQEFIYDNAAFSKVATATDGPNTAEPRQTLAWGYTRVTEQSYNSAGQVVGRACWDLIAATSKC